MTEQEVELLVRKILYKQKVEDSIKELYLIINGEELIVEEEQEHVGRDETRSSFGVLKDQKYRDINGEMIYFPSEGSHYDKALQKTFNSKKEKYEYMKRNNIFMDGSSDHPERNRVPEAGDTRLEKVRR